MSRIAGLLLLGLLGISPAALTADEEQGSMRGFALLDSDGDGIISLDEFEAPEQRLFSELDGDQNGVLSLDEYQLRRQGNGERRGPADRELSDERRARMEERMNQQIAERFTEMDLDGDGGLTVEELQQATFARLDADNSGGVDQTEFQAQRRQYGPSVRGPGVRRMPSR